jgi:microcystin degradation protein MlrC
LDPKNYPIVIAKGVMSPRPAFEPIASKIIALDSPGVTAANFKNFTFNLRRKPMFPFEKKEAFYP